jgi:hypothetical protein
VTDFREVDLNVADDDPRLSRPDSNTGRLQRALLDQLRLHQAEGTIPTNPRFLFYELEQAGVVSKIPPLKADGTRRRKEDRQYLSEALTHLRDKGIIPWGWVIDERREYTDWSVAETVADYLVEQLDWARINPWTVSPAPLILCESGSVAGILENLAYRYAVPITATSGQAKAHLINKVAPRLKRGQRVIYLGDADLSGGLIEVHTNRVLIEHAPRWAYSAGGVLVPALWERLALSEEQVDADERLLGLAITKTDRRFDPPYEHRAVELETLGQRQILDMVTARLDELLPQPLDEVLVLEDAQREEVREILRRAGLIGGDQ